MSDQEPGPERPREQGDPHGGAPQQGHVPGWGAQGGPPPQWGPPGWAPPYPGQPPYPVPAPYPGRAAVPLPLPRFPHPEPREYHQMLRTWNYAWWKPLLGTAIVVVGMFLAPFLLIPVLAVGVWLEGGPFWDTFGKAATLQEVGPASLLYLNLSLGAAILVTWFVMRVVHRMRPRWLTSVVPKMRWKLLFVFIGLSVVALVAMLAVSILIGVLVPGEDDAVMSAQGINELTATTAALALVVLLTTPLQAAGEEYVFRGYLLQAIGSFWSFADAPAWLARWLAIVITAALFAVAHGGQNFPLFFDRFMFGLIAGWLVIRTGGLEAGIAMHILNNFLAFGYALLFSDLGSSLTVTEASWWNIPVTLTQAGTYALLVLWVARRKDIQRRTAPPVEAMRLPHGAGLAPVPTHR